MGAQIILIASSTIFHLRMASTFGDVDVDVDVDVDNFRLGSKVVARLELAKVTRGDLGTLLECR